MSKQDNDKLWEVAVRIREMREICGFSKEQMAEKTEVTLQEYSDYEDGKLDFPFTFILKCSQAFGIGMPDLLEGSSAKLMSYTVTRGGRGLNTAKEEGIRVDGLASAFRNKLANPYYVKYEYEEELQDKPIHLTKHAGQEFDYSLSGHLKVQIGENIEELNPGDSIYYNSSTYHGMIATGGHDCEFIAVVIPGEDQKETVVMNTVVRAGTRDTTHVADKFIECTKTRTAL